MSTRITNLGCGIMRRRCKAARAHLQCAHHHCSSDVELLCESKFGVDLNVPMCAILAQFRQFVSDAFRDLDAEHAQRPEPVADALLQDSPSAPPIDAETDALHALMLDESLCVPL